uniref:Small ribosomal subunit protein bS18c n=1 Tax=Pseudomuriella schumacherensis TaxID=889459 RepID=A0A140HB68_PSESB|nr:ribosomal protein S18 [Pseudomuriella schumacherensis]AMO01417.1 ribosomal protein S18 [Pseudomuriella schumacherensis]
MSTNNKFLKTSQNSTYSNNTSRGKVGFSSTGNTKNFSAQSNSRQTRNNNVEVTGNLRKSGRKVLSVSQILARVRKQKQRKLEQKKRKKPIKPIIPPKSLIIILTDKAASGQGEKAVYNRRIIDYKHCGLLQRYIGLGGKILPKRQTKLTAKQQRYVAKTIKSARIMGLLPFVTKERGFFR